MFDDCDLDAAVAGAIACKLRDLGQTCVCANRIYVQKGVHDQFAEKFAAKVQTMRVGPGFGDVTHGPLIPSRAVRKVEDHVQDAQQKGARLLVGGKGLPDLGPIFTASRSSQALPKTCRLRLK